MAWSKMNVLGTVTLREATVDLLTTHLLTTHQKGDHLLLYRVDLGLLKLQKVKPQIGGLLYNQVRCACHGGGDASQAGWLHQVIAGFPKYQLLTFTMCRVLC